MDAAIQEYIKTACQQINLPDSAMTLVYSHWDAFLLQHFNHDSLKSAPLSFFMDLSYIFACSDFAASHIIINANAITGLMSTWGYGLSQESYNQSLAGFLKNIHDVESLNERIRYFRNTMLTRIVARDVLQKASTEETLEELSFLADACVTQVMRKHHAFLSQEWGSPVFENGDPMPLIVIALGKWGGLELNFSSDIDLIFCFPFHGELTGKRGSISYENFFLKLARLVTHTLNQFTSDGFVYRVDLRLRPYGESGPMVMSFSALEGYYLKHGRDWERYALIKSRILCVDDVGVKSQIQHILHAFVYRRYTDYTVIDSLREMKTLMLRDVSLRGEEDNIKRGNGGIRQIEFFVQAFQLLRGGQNKFLQDTRLLQVLNYLAKSKTLETSVANDLVSAYLFFRELENRLQMLNDQQTHLLPADTGMLNRIVFSMRLNSRKELLHVLNQHKSKVIHHFNKILNTDIQIERVPEKKEILRENLDVMIGVWASVQDENSTINQFMALGVSHDSQASEMYVILNQFIQSHRCRHLSLIARKRLDKLMPILLCGIVESANPVILLKRVINLLESIVKRSVYLVLLIENTHQLKIVLALFSSSAWIAERVSQFPYLLDEIIHSTPLLSPDSEQDMRDLLRQRLLSAPEGDFERLMDTLRQFKAEQFLRTAVAEITMTLSVNQVSIQLTHITAALLHAVQHAAAVSLVENDAALYDCLMNHFAIIAYGKLGSFELSYSSDLDLVFVYENNVIDDEEIFIRLAQRIIRCLNVSTASGVLFSVDTRLRPSGSAGLLVTSINSFRHYQLEQAWTWEHQALVRARVLTGSDELQTAFLTVREEVLTHVRDREKLRADILDMREKIRMNIPVSSQEFYLKALPGGLVDIEFISQYLVLAYAHEFQVLTQTTVTSSIISVGVKLGLIASEDAQECINAYALYRTEYHYEILANDFACDKGRFEEILSRIYLIFKKILLC